MLNRVNSAFSKPEDWRSTIKGKNEFVLLAVMKSEGEMAGEPEEHIVAFVSWYSLWYKGPAGFCRVMYLATLQAVTPGTHPEACKVPPPVSPPPPRALAAGGGVAAAAPPRLLPPPHQQPPPPLRLHRA